MEKKKKGTVKGKGFEEFAKLIIELTRQMGGPIVPSLLGRIAEYLESVKKGSPNKNLYEDAATACGILVNLFGDVRSARFAIGPCPYGAPRSR